jgi:hypothetical protein
MELTPFFAWVALLLAGLIAFGGWKLMGEEGTTLSEQFEQARDRAAGAVSAAASPQPAAPPGPATATDRRRKMSWVMAGCGAAVILGAALPWVSGPGARLSDAAGSGLGVWQGWVVAVAGAGLCLYAYQGLSANIDRMRHHGWAIAAVVVAVCLPALISSNIDQFNQTSRADVEAGAGIIVAFLAGLVAIWPLIVLRRDSRTAVRTAGPATPSPPHVELKPEAKPEPARRAEPAPKAKAAPRLEPMPQATTAPEPEPAKAVAPEAASAPGGVALAAPPSPSERLDGPGFEPQGSMESGKGFCSTCGAPRSG